MSHEAGRRRGGRSSSELVGPGRCGALLRAGVRCPAAAGGRAFRGASAILSLRAWHLRRYCAICCGAAVPLLHYLVQRHRAPSAERGFGWRRHLPHVVAQLVSGIVVVHDAVVVVERHQPVHGAMVAPRAVQLGHAAGELVLLSIHRALQPRLPPPMLRHTAAARNEALVAMLCRRPQSEENCRLYTCA